MSKKRGFTIIELLVVISVILILAAIITPAVHKAKSKARRVQCLSNIRQCGQAGIMYAQDWNDVLPEAAATRAAWFALPGIDDPSYLQTAVRSCPADGNNELYTVWQNNADLKMQQVPGVQPLLCDYSTDADWADADDNHEGDGGNVFYVTGEAKFLVDTVIPGNVSLTRDNA